ncbi:response regulator [Shewanella maritima]|uniref:Response regulator n=1 Tax=Shewanella maritima TaxID=2520507 RepID=A0A411PG56_9GAMM|nr:response regulator [Shewanella maritima]QBF82444.1 response regulator [Shewanella maritima]
MTRILIAEDDNNLRQNMVDILELEGFEVVATADAEAAIDVASSRSFDIALMDLVMPGMTGVEAISNLRQANPFMAIIIVTAYATVDTAVDAMKKGSDSVITKPFDSVDLVVSIRRSIEEKQLLKASRDIDPDSVYSALANSLRRETLKQLALHQQLKFMDLCRLVGVEDHTKFNFHLRQLKKAGLVMQNESKIYILTNTGQFVLQNHSLS